MPDLQRACILREYLLNCAHLGDINLPTGKLYYRLTDQAGFTTALKLLKLVIVSL